ncbi:cobalt/nickel transport system ATP-binding protein [Anaerobacterium chartisolvens]|uniref:Cobalt/nickel transport system ATP-binding protein n=1 Tax=Anaerobacterium chartisolvens TaxID=1297424 RepID=A0A369BA66_9FIRM|nr:ABC transporter ATP-binding protein [Anaerobacterium chartisolvens]RCX18429.1 cobalt/nickel transport system ATP-binding protein [Anaerobacterium chartisolvens]
MSDYITSVKNLVYTYPDGHTAVRDISFEIKRGESIGIIGANGAGKSTLLMLIMGLLMPQSGEIWVEELKVTPKSLTAVRQRIGMVLQDPDDQLFMANVYDDVAFGPRNYKLDEAEVNERVTKALQTVGILYLKDRPPFRLSGGEKRAAAIASVLSMQPGILVMDEPTSSLDPKARRRLISMLKELSQTKIITSHDMDMVMEVCDRAIVLKEGRIAADGLARDILADCRLLEECGLESPLSLQNCPLCGSKKQDPGH